MITAHAAAVYCPEAPVRPTDPVQIADVELPLTEHGAHTGNLWVRDTLKDMGVPVGTVYDAVNIVAEFSQNASRHVGPLKPGRRPIMAFTVAVWSDRIRVTVSDPGDLFDAPETVPGGSGEHESGYGLELIVSSLAAGWGIERIYGGKLAWADIKIGGDA